MNNSYSEGGCIDAWCPCCNLKLSHTIIAIVDRVPKKIRCNTCDDHHIFNAKASGKSRTGSARKSRARNAAHKKYLALLTGGESADSKKYTIKGNFKKDEIIDHLKFGVGIVISVIDFHKINILFKDGPRLLTQNQ